MESLDEQLALRPAALAKLSAEQVPKLKLKWAFGFEGDISAFSQPTVIGNQAFIAVPAASCTPCALTLDACSGRFRLRARFDRRSWPHRSTAATFCCLATSPVGSTHSMRPRARDLAQATRGARGGPVECASGRCRWRRVHRASSWEESRALNPEYPCCTFRGSVTALRVRDGSVVWKTRTRCRAWPNMRVHDIDRRCDVGAVRRWNLVLAHARPEAPPVVRDDRQQLLDAGHANQRCRDGARSRHGSHCWTKQLHPDDVYNSACSTEPKELVSTGKGPDYDRITHHPGVDDGWA